MFEWKSNRENAPMDEADLVPLAGALLLVLEIVHGPPTLCLGQIGNKLVIVLARRLLLDDDLRQVLRDIVDDVLLLLAELKLLERIQTFRVDGDARGLCDEYQ